MKHFLYQQWELRSQILMPIMLGMLAFFLIVGWQSLQFENIAGIQQNGDSVTHYLGWLFFRNSPWSFPIGANPNYGIEIASSIFFSDSIPLFAFIFKPFSSLLPGTFQYAGLWLLFCFVAQSWFAWRIIGLITQDVVVKVCATGLFLFSPPMLHRIGGHDSLVGHWLILAALYLCLGKNKRHKHWLWLSLVMLAALVHAYLLAMVLALWASDMIRRLLIKESHIKGVIIESGIVLSGAFISLWQAGFFMVRSGLSTEGYGYYRMNLLAPINPVTNAETGAAMWSFVLPGFPQTGGDFEGFNYFGLGILVLIIIVSPYVVGRLRQLKFDFSWLPLFIICLVLSLFAISNNIGIGYFTFSYWLPSIIIDAANMLRGSGRMFWPVFYLILWYSLFLLVKNHSRKIVLAIIAGVLVLQVADTKAAWGPFSEEFKRNSKTWQSSLKSADWPVIAAQYKKIRLIPPGNTPIYADFANLAATHGLATDGAYLARYDVPKLQDLYKRTDLAVKTGNYEKDSLYIMDATDRSLVNMAKSRLNTERDLFTVIDGYAVIAPEWNSRHKVK